MNTGNYIKPLNGLRAIAIILVLLYHSIVNIEDYALILTQGEYFSLKHLIFSGWVGVDLFFVLSGFLIGSKLISDNIDFTYLKNFAIKRFFRIAPAYYFSATLTLIRVKLVPTLLTGGLMQTIKLFSLPFLAHILFIQDYVWSKPEIDWVFWSIPIEMKFYLVLPFIVLAIKPIKKLEIKILILVAGYILYLILKTRIIDTIFGNTPVNIFEFSYFARLPFHLSLDGLWMGVICAYYSKTAHYKNLGRTFTNILCCAGISIFFILATYVYAFTKDQIILSVFEQKYKVALISLSFSIILLASVRGCFLSDCLNNKILAFIAKISYSLYLTHVFGMMLNDLLLKNLIQHFESFIICWMIAFPIYFGFCLIPAYLLHELIEMPCLKYAKQKLVKKRPDNETI